jgi:hypothetical protein
MKTLALSIFAVAVALGFALGGVAHSQAPGAPLTPPTPLQRLEMIRTKNKELLEKQSETIKKLDELQLQSQQLKFMGHRT